jgi:trans-2,3-dihydro-3-hydroxyanthranilate isomerase
MRRRLLTLDVCTSRRCAGHPPAAVLDAEGLNGTVMHWIAREFHLAETIGVLPLQEASHRARIRICGQDV